MSEGFSKAVLDVIDERWRQADREGFSSEHDDAHRGFELAKAGACYALRATYKDGARRDQERRKLAPGQWPWSLEWWKPKDRRCDLVRAAALLIAEIERLDRLSGAAAASSGTTPTPDPSPQGGGEHVAQAVA